MKNLMQTAPIVEGKDFEGLIPETNKYLPTIGLPEEEVIISSQDVDTMTPRGAHPLEVTDVYEIMNPSGGDDDSSSSDDSE